MRDEPVYTRPETDDDRRIREMVERGELKITPRPDPMPPFSMEPLTPADE